MAIRRLRIRQGLALVAPLILVALVFHASPASADNMPSNPGTSGGGGNNNNGGNSGMSCPNGYTHYNVNGREWCQPPATSPPASNFTPKTTPKTHTTQPPAGNFVTDTTAPAITPSAQVSATVPDPGPQTCAPGQALNGMRVQLIASQPCDDFDTRLINSLPTKAEEPNFKLRAFAVVILLLALLFAIAGASIGELLRAISD